MATRTGLKFIHLANGTVQAHYKTHSPLKLETIIAGLKDRAYTVTNVIPLLHTREMLLIIPIGLHVKKEDYDLLTASFKGTWRAMREEQKAKESKTFEEMEQDFEELGLS